MALQKYIKKIITVKDYNKKYNYIEYAKNMLGTMK